MSDFQPIVSSNLDSAKYDGGSIIVRFKNGTAYKYDGCDEIFFNEFKRTFDGKNGRSAGKFFNAHIKPIGGESLVDWK